MYGDDGTKEFEIFINSSIELLKTFSMMIYSIIHNSWSIHISSIKIHNSAGSINRKNK